MYGGTIACTSIRQPNFWSRGPLDFAWVLFGYSINASAPSNHSVPFENLDIRPYWIDSIGYSSLMCLVLSYLCQAHSTGGTHFAVFIANLLRRCVEMISYLNLAVYELHPIL